MNDHGLIIHREGEPDVVIQLTEAQAQQLADRMAIEAFMVPETVAIGLETNFFSAALINDWIFREMFLCPLSRR
jgi:hypothetical protein